MKHENDLTHELISMDNAISKIREQLEIIAESHRQLHIEIYNKLTEQNQKEDE